MEDLSEENELMEEMVNVDSEDKGDMEAECKVKIEDEEEDPGAVNIPSKSRSLRARSIQKRLLTELNKDAKKQRGPKPKSGTMSKYRRKTANAKERNRMKQVNDAFERLRTVIPDEKVMLNEDKSTKVTTLHCAIKYINSLQQLIDDCVAGNIQPQTFLLSNQEEDKPNNKKQKPKTQNNKKKQLTGVSKKSKKKTTKSPTQRSKSSRVILPLKGNSSGTKAGNNKNLWNNSSGRPEVLRDLAPNAAAYNGLAGASSTVTFSQRDHQPSKPSQASPPGQNKAQYYSNMPEENQHKMLKFKFINQSPPENIFPPIDKYLQTGNTFLPNNWTNSQKKTLQNQDNKLKCNKLNIRYNQNQHSFFQNQKPQKTCPAVKEFDVNSRYQQQLLTKCSGPKKLPEAGKETLSDEISVHISLLSPGTNNDNNHYNVRDGMAGKDELYNYSNSYSEGSSPTNVIDFSENQGVSQVGRYEMDQDGQLFVLDDIQQILKEAENFDVCL